MGIGSVFQTWIKNLYKEQQTYQNRRDLLKKNPVLPQRNTVLSPIAFAFCPSPRIGYYN